VVLPSARRLLLAWLLTAAKVIDWVEGLLRRSVSNNGGRRTAV